MDLSESRCLETEFGLQPKTMVFFKPEGLPEKAGRAVLQFWPGVAAPERDKELIKLPSRQGELVYHALRGGGQFLVEVGRHAYFGGTDDDESVFLVEVTKEALQAFADGSEREFYDSLKPKALKKLEEDNPHGETRRQGDIFAFWCPIFGKSASELVMEYTKELESWRGTTTVQVVDAVDIQFGTTRHYVNGRSIRITWEDERRASRDDETYYVGEMTAPDHKPLVFGKRPHLLFPAANVVRPRPGCGDR